MAKELLDHRELCASPVVANCHMNRERNLAGYARDLGIDPLAILRAHVDFAGRAVWLDSCCGTGRALIEAREQLAASGKSDVQIEGVDLAGMFAAHPFAGALVFRAQSLEDWQPSPPYALITCVHGLHYVGDKLQAIAKLVACLDTRGLFVANLDLAGFRFPDGRSVGRTIAAWLRTSGLAYDRRRRLVRCEGPRRLTIPFKYLGADDRVGPNYTGQAAVASYYQPDA